QGRDGQDAEADGEDGLERDLRGGASRYGGSHCAVLPEFAAADLLSACALGSPIESGCQPVDLSAVTSWERKNQPPRLKCAQRRRSLIDYEHSGMNVEW